MQQIQTQGDRGETIHKETGLNYHYAIGPPGIRPAGAISDLMVDEWNHLNKKLRN